MSGYNYGFGMATPEKIAKIQDEQAERERARRVKEANLAAFDAARDAERNGRGGSVSMTEVGPGGRVTSFSNTTVGPDGSVQREGFGDAWNLQGRVGSEFADISRRSAMAQRHNAQLGTDSVSAAMRAAMANGGRLPQNLVGLLSRNLGMDGNNQSVFSAGFLNNGDFDIDIVTRGANGGLQRTTKKISPREQLGIVNSTPGVWGNDGIAVSQRLYDGLRNTMGKSELPPQGVYADNLRAYNTKKESAEMQKFLISCAQEAIKAASKTDPKSGTRVDPKTAFLQRALLNDKVRAEITQGTEPELDKDGNPVIGDDGNQVMKPASDEVQRSRLENLANRAFMFFQGGQGGPQGGRAEAQMQVVNQILNRLYPPTPPDVAAFQQGQRERQMRQVEEAQAREDVTRRPQQVINYFKDGRWYSGNGYIRDGRVYDGQGYEIEGATPAEMARNKDGSVYSNENGWVARALPSARELVGGRGGAETQVAQAGTEQQEQLATQQAQQPAQGTQQTVAQGSTASATSDIDAKKRQLAMMEAELKRRQSVGKMAQDVVSEQNAALDGPRVGKSTGNDFASTGYGGINVDMDLENIPRNEKELDESLRQKELATVRSISNRGGEVWHDKDGNVHARIGGFAYLPKEIRDKYPDGIVNDLQLDAIDDIQRRAYVAMKDVAAKREKNLEALRARARSLYQTESQRNAYVEKEDKAWRRENDPGFVDRTEEEGREFGNFLTSLPG